MPDDMQLPEPARRSASHAGPRRVGLRSAVAREPVRSGLAYRRRQLSARLFILRRVGLRHAIRRRRLKERYLRLGPAGATAAESMWREAASELGADVRRVSPMLLEFELHGVTTRLRDQMTTPLTDRVSHALALDKPVAYRVLAAAGVPVPAHAVIEPGDVRAARAFLADSRPPVLVKPASGGGGSGVVGMIYTPEQLERALVDAGRFHSLLLLEEQADGDSYRLLVLDGALVDVLRRPRPRVVGDGVSAIEELMFREYERRLENGADVPNPFEVDLDTLLALDHAGLGLRSVPSAGDVVVVKSVSNYVGRELIETLSPEEVPGIVGPAQAAARALGVRLAGVDVVTTDPVRPLRERGVVLEVNPVPGLLQHYRVADPSSATPVARLVLGALLRASSADGAPRSEETGVGQ